MCRPVHWLDSFCVQSVGSLSYFWVNELFQNLLRGVGFLGSSDGEESACNAGEPGSVPKLGRSPGKENDN